MRLRCLQVLLALPVLGLLTFSAWLLHLPRGQQQIAAFSTSVHGRSESQVHNVRLALAALDGQVVASGKEFSFNRAVGPWGEDRGYRKAPVSYSGDLTRDWGGGVCQASSTLYNAVLLAGLPILERHRHYWPASYVPPGQDAAVAYPNIDLRFRNCFPSPLRIAARIEGESVLIRLYAREQPPRVVLDRRVLAVSKPGTVVRSGLSRAAPAVIPGQPGYEVALYRVFPGGQSRRELISRDSYPAQNRTILR